MAALEYRFLDPLQACELTGDEDSARLVIESAIESLTDAQTRLDAAMQSHDTEEAYAVLHTLKGALPIYANAALVMAVTQVEQTKHGVVPGNIFELTAKLHADVAILLDEVHRFLSGP